MLHQSSKIQAFYFQISQTQNTMAPMPNANEALRLKLIKIESIWSWFGSGKAPASQPDLLDLKPIELEAV